MALQINPFNQICDQITSNTSFQEYSNFCPGIDPIQNPSQSVLFKTIEVGNRALFQELGIRWPKNFLEGAMFETNYIPVLLLAIYEENIKAAQAILSLGVNPNTPLKRCSLSSEYFFFDIGTTPLRMALLMLEDSPEKEAFIEELMSKGGCDIDADPDTTPDDIGHQRLLLQRLKERIRPHVVTAVADALPVVGLPELISDFVLGPPTHFTTDGPFNQSSLMFYE